MNNKDLLKAIGDINEKYLGQDATKTEKNQEEFSTKAIIMKKLKYILVPVCIILVAVIGIKQSGLLEKQLSPQTAETEWKTKEIHLDETSTAEGIATVPRWEEKTITEKYYSVKFLDTTYNASRGAKISSDKIGEKLETTMLTERDTYTNKDYSINANIFKVTDFPTKCVIAIQFEGDNNYYVYTNAYYKPETLGDFINDLKLKETVSFGTVNYEYAYTDSKGEKQSQKVEFYDVDDTTIWQMLFNDLSLENIYSDNETYTSDYFVKSVTIGVDIPLLGIENISVSLTDKGYLLTNILETGKGFYIGEEKVQKFIDYIIENYEGYKIVYVHDNQITEEETKTDNNNVIEDKIMVMENGVDGYTTKEYEASGNTNVGNKIEAYIP